MVAYNGPRKPCYDCMKADATEYLGKRIKTPTGRADLHVCRGCADTRLGKNIPQDAPTPTTRADNFTQGHDNARWWQPELGQ